MTSTKLKAVRIILVLASSAALVIGIFWGEAVSVYQKAIRICMECIGLG